MTSKRIVQTNQQQNSEKPQESGILQRAAVRSVSDLGEQSTEDKEAQPLSNLAFSKDFSQVPISTAKPQQMMAKLRINQVEDKNDVVQHYQKTDEGKLSKNIELLLTNEPELYASDAKLKMMNQIGGQMEFQAGGEKEVNSSEQDITKTLKQVHFQEKYEADFNHTGEVKKFTPSNQPQKSKPPQASTILQKKDISRISSQSMNTSGMVQGNKTGLPNNLKAGIENLSGISMDDVKVHYNSSKPAHLQALAYTQGTDIHVAPGQEKHLAHEAWHVVQQKQGRVKPTIQLRGTALNDDRELESEADVMGEKAVKLNKLVSQRQEAVSSNANRVQTVQLKPNLKIASYMSGEQYITKSALIVNPSTKVTIFINVDSMMKTYKEEAEKHGMGENVVKYYNQLFNKQLESESTVRDDVKNREAKNAMKMWAFLTLGIEKPSRVMIDPESNKKSEISGSTATVRDELAKNRKETKQKLRDQLFPESFQQKQHEKISKYYYEKGLKEGQKLALFWVRKSGEKLGAAQWLDTNETMLAQMMIKMKTQESSRKMILIGDQVELPKEIDGSEVPKADLDLMEYWKKDFPVRSDITSQLYFINLIMERNKDTISIGQESGILEIPHILGMPTIYLENKHLAKRKGLRWQMLAGHTKEEYTEAEWDNLEVQVAGGRASGKQSKRFRQKEAEIENAKLGGMGIEVNQVLPKLQRLQTTLATELWAMKKWIYKEITEWIGGVGAEGRPEPESAKDQEKRMEQLKKLIIVSIGADIEGGEEGKLTERWKALYLVRYHWVQIRDKQEKYMGSDIEGDSLRKLMKVDLEKHRLKQTEVKEFGELLNDYSNPRYWGEEKQIDYKLWLYWRRFLRALKEGYELQFEVESQNSREIL